MAPQQARKREWQWDVKQYNFSLESVLYSGFIQIIHKVEIRQTIVYRYYVFSPGA